MRKIKSRERANGMKYCTFCKPVRVVAIYRSQYRSIDQHVQLACEGHVDLIQDGEKPEPIKKESIRVFEDGYSEADCQTWMRL